MGKHKLVSDAIANNQADAEGTLAYFHDGWSSSAVKGVFATFRETGRCGSRCS
ncbi:MAG: hypothetical protein R2724_07095 [Bryobacterales bacterium]